MHLHCNFVGDTKSREMIVGWGPGCHSYRLQQSVEYTNRYLIKLCSRKSQSPSWLKLTLCLIIGSELIGQESFFLWKRAWKSWCRISWPGASSVFWQQKDLLGCFSKSTATRSRKLLFCSIWPLWDCLKWCIQFWTYRYRENVSEWKRLQPRNTKVFRGLKHKMCEERLTEQDLSSLRKRKLEQGAHIILEQLKEMLYSWWS